MPKHLYLVIHYHRIQNDYDDWHLCIQSQSTVTDQLILAPITPTNRTSFGIVFRIPKSTLPHTSLTIFPIHFSSIDNPPRSFTSNSSTTQHIFLSQANSKIHFNPTQISLTKSLDRFLFFTLPTQLETPWLVVFPPSPAASIHLFPATPKFTVKQAHLLYILDLLSIPSIPTIPCNIQIAAATLQNPSPHPTPHIPSTFFKFPDPSVNSNQTQGALLSYNNSNNINTPSFPYIQVCQSKQDKSALLTLIIDQAETFFARSPTRHVSHFQNPLSLIDLNPPFSLPLIPTPAPTSLRVYLHKLPSASISNSDLIEDAVTANSTSVIVRRLDQQYVGAQIFDLDISNVLASVVQDGLTLSCGDQHVSWTPAHGTHVILAESFPRLLSPKQIDFQFVYQRFDEIVDWKRWQLRVWCSMPSSNDSTDTNNKHQKNHNSYETIIPATRPVSSLGGCIFSKPGLLFPHGSTVNVQPFRKIITPQELEPDSVHYEHDIIRKFPSGDPPSQTMFLLQGDRRLHPTTSQTSLRHIRLRYRRFRSSDYKGWDLWTWDADDPSAPGVSVAPVDGSETRAWIDFIIDRSQYPAGAAIAIVPRLGREEWEQKDDPPRIWREELFQNVGTGLEVSVATGLLPSVDYLSKDALKAKSDTDDNIPTFLIAQQTDIVFNRLDDVKSMLTAYVSGPDSVIIKSPVPVEWVSPPQRGRVHALSEAKFKLCEEQVAPLLGNGYTADKLRGTSMTFTKVKSVSPTEYTLFFEQRKTKSDLSTTPTGLFNEDFPVERVVVSVPGFDEVPLQWKTKENWDEYFYSGKLGWEYTPKQCSFRCFAPTADQVSIILYPHVTETTGREEIPMRRIPEGCWKAIVRGDLKGKYYKLLATGSNKRLFPGVEVIDPYSRCNTAHTGRGLIFGFESTKIHPRPNIKPEETIVYEFHIRDLTIDEDCGIVKRGKFLGVTERGSRMKIKSDETVSMKVPLTPWPQEEMPGVADEFKLLDKLSTGLDHIAQMGVTAVQILPIQDFDNDESDDKAYRWGYMPVHYNSPDGWYASKTDTVARVTEFKQLVDAVHKAGMKVIMDVVYNHTAEDSNEFNLDARFSFNGLAPRYYYRTCGNTPVAHTGDSTCGVNGADQPRCGACYSNGSGCGNEFRSESPMGRKFMIDSLLYWATEYQVDGFRFDLLGLIDVDSLEIASQKLKEIDPNIIIYGEPWCGGLTPIEMTDKGKQRSKGFGVFNNTFRDAIRGSPFGAEETFVMDGGRHPEVKGGIVGSIDTYCDSPLETINYVECHDNYTLWDHMRFYLRSRTDDITFTEGDMRRMSKLAAFIVFTSQGIPFMQAGQEMCRTKFDVENSYESPDDINMIRWRTKESEWSTVQYYRGLILLRKSHPELFCKQDAKDIRQSITFYEDLGIGVPERCIAFRINGDQKQLFTKLVRDNPDVDREYAHDESLKWTQVVVLLNPTPTEVTFQLPEREQDVLWFQVVDSVSAGVRNIRGPAIGFVVVQGRSAALLRRASQKDTHEAQLGLRLAAITDSYACFQGNDIISRYAVGLDSELTPSEREIQEQQTLQGERFRASSEKVNPAQSNTEPPSTTVGAAN